jgi:predicted enzyme related to lactoylglutathione lyase
MARVIGIGGVFLKARQPDTLGAWYQRHLGFDIQAWGGASFPCDRPGGVTAWSLFPEASDYFAPSTAAFMVNYVVEDLDALLEALRSEGCEVDPRVEASEFGKFGWVMDPEGNRIELWQPPDPPAPLR